ncbi:unnamed protein product [Paramecium octaurelia]|uniref:Uncharacterized protein n=1 Tax=Paramecium octaurelia TaxID=43137 RepID=A0A8S1V2H7_PAROT|nr:unnamed protein product [Paramecium octaurelia]
MPFQIKLFEKQVVFMLSHLLTLEYNMPKLFQLLIIIYSVTQSISYSFYYQYTQDEQLRHSLTKITLLTRLYLYIDNPNIKSGLFWLLAIVQNFIFLAASIVAYKNQYKMGALSFWTRYISVIFSFYIYYFSTAFFPVIFEICLFKSSDLAQFCVSIIVMLETLIIMILGELVFRRGLILKSTSQLYINMTTYSYIIKILKLMQIIFFFYLQTKFLSQMIQCVINILIQLCFIAEQIRAKVYAQKIYSNTTIIFSSIGLVLSFDILLTQSTNNNNYWILVCIIMIKILMSCEEFQIDKISNYGIHQLKYLYTFLDLSNLEKSRTKLQVFMLFQSHQQSCDNKKTCFCTKYQNDQFIALIKIIEGKIEEKLHGKSEISKDLICTDYAQILFRSHQYVKAQQHITRFLTKQQSNYEKKQNPLSKITIFLLEYLKGEVLNQVMIQITEKIVLSNQHNKLLDESLKSFVLNENSDSQIIANLKKIIQTKIQFYYNFVEHQNASFGNVNYALQFIQQIQQFKEMLLNRYNQFPTSSNQNILKYFTLHILNDYIDSFNINRGKAFEDDKFNQFSGQMYHKIFGINPAYFITELNSELEVIITKKSQRAQYLLEQWKIQQHEQKYHSNIELNAFLPEYVQLKHSNLIERFLSEGQNKYYQQQNLSFLKQQEKVMMPIQIMISMNQTNYDKFSFLTFFYESLDYRSYIVVDKHLEILNVSSNISESLFFNEAKIHSSCVTKIIPNFQQLVSTHQHQFYNQEIKLVKEYHHQKVPCSFTGNIKIDRKFENQYKCYFVELDNIRAISKKFKDENSTLYMASLTQFPGSSQKLLNINSEFDDSEEKMIPYINFENHPIPENSLCIIQQEQQRQTINQIDTNLVCTLQMVELGKSHNIFEPLSQKRLLHSSKYSHDENMKKQVNKIVEEDEFLEIGSTSSVTAIRRSKYYKKFEIITILMKSKKQSQKIVKMNKFIFLYTFVILLGLIIQILMVQNLEQFIEDIKTLSIRYDVVEPYESFYVSRFSQVNYREQLGGGFINASVYAQLTKYPFSTFGLMYDHLRNSMYSILERREIDQLSDNEYITISFLNKSYVGYTKNVTIRSLANILMNYQYDFKLGLTIRSVAFDSPFFYFTSKNYLTIKHTFDGLNKVVLDATLQRSQLEKDKWLSVLLPFITISLFLCIIIINSYREYNQIMNSIFQYLMDLDQQILDGEKKRLQKHLSIVNNELEKVKKFEFDIEAIDAELEESNIISNRNNTKRDGKRFKITNNFLRTTAAIGLIHFLLFLTFYITIYLIIERYFEKYDQTSIIFQRISDLGVDIPTLYAQREVLYRRTLRYFFLTDAEIDGVYDVFFQAYNKVEEFTQLNIDLSSEDYLFDENAVNFYEAINIGNLCDYQTEQFKELANSTCGLAMNGNLLKGLSQILPYILYTLKTQYDDSKNFTILPTNTRLELEGATIIGNVMSTVISELYDNLLISCLRLINFTQIPCIIFLVFQSICIVIYIAIMNENHKQQFQSIKQSIFLFPRQTLIFDDQFYRNFRSIIKDEGIQQ